MKYKASRGSGKRAMPSASLRLGDWVEGIAPSMPGWAACHGSDGAMPSIRSAMHTIYFTASQRMMPRWLVSRNSINCAISGVGESSQRMRPTACVTFSFAR